MFDDLKQDLDIPVEFEYKVKFLKKGKLRAIIINEDMSATEYFVNFPESYVIKIKKHYYFVVPKCFIRVGKYPTMLWFYNNPMPIELSFKHSELTALDLMDQKEIDKLSREEQVIKAGVIIDAEMVKLGYDSRAMGNIYGRSGLTLRQWMWIAGGILVVILVILQLSGKVDVFGMLTMSGKK